MRNHKGRWEYKALRRFAGNRQGCCSCGCLLSFLLLLPVGGKKSRLTPYTNIHAAILQSHQLQIILLNLIFFSFSSFCKRVLACVDKLQFSQRNISRPFSYRFPPLDYQNLYRPSIYLYIYISITYFNPFISPYPWGKLTYT